MKDERRGPTYPSVFQVGRYTITQNLKKHLYETAGENKAFFTGEKCLPHHFTVAFQIKRRGRCAVTSWSTRARSCAQTTSDSAREMAALTRRKAEKERGKDKTCSRQIYPDKL